MTSEYLEPVAGLSPERTYSSVLYKNRKPMVFAFFAIAAALNLVDLLSTSFGMANGLVETYPTSLMIMGAAGSLGFALAKVSFSLLLLPNARFLAKRLERMSPRATNVILVLSFGLVAAYLVPVASNLAALARLA